jgi:hypothetical protein
MCELGKWWVQIAPSVTPFVALFAIMVAWRQLALNRANQRETTAKAIFREYLKLAFEHPDLAAGDYQLLLKNGRKQEYEWFVGYFLWAAEEILDYANNDATWQFNIQWQANKHRDYFKEDPEFLKSEIQGYNKIVKTIVERAVQQA